MFVANFALSVMKQCQKKCLKPKIVRAQISRENLCNSRNKGKKEKVFFLINLPTTVRGMRNGKLISKKLRFHKACLRITPRLKRHIADAYKFVGEKPKTVYDLIIKSKPTTKIVGNKKVVIGATTNNDGIKLSTEMTNEQLTAIRAENEKKYENLIKETKKQNAEKKYKKLLERIEILMDKQKTYYKEINTTDKLLNSDYSLVSAANLIKYRQLLEKSKGKMNDPKFKALVKKLKKLIHQQDSFYSILSQQ